MGRHFLHLVTEVQVKRAGSVVHNEENNGAHEGMIEGRLKVNQRHAGRISQKFSSIHQGNLKYESQRWLDDRVRYQSSIGCHPLV